MNLLFPLFAVLIWSLNAVVSKAAAGAIDPAAISFYRWLLALVTLTPFILPSVWRNRAEIKKYWWKFMILGLLGMVLYQSLAYYAAHTVSALFMGIIASLIPLLTVLISLVVLSVVPTVGIAVGSLVLQQGVGMGELMMFAASASYALYGVLTKRWAIPVPNWQSLYLQIIFGVVMLVPNFLMANDVQLNEHNIPLVLFAGIPASIIAPFLWIKGVHHLGANLATIFMNLTPIFTAVIAVLFLHEQLHSYHLIGGGITLIGVILAQRLRTPLFGRREPTLLVEDKQES
jgi:drug/metabolite transporter (DMT)-like permease